MKQLSLLCLMFISLCFAQVSAQCDNTLVEKAASQSGGNAVYLREFKVKFDGSERDKAIPVARYPILLTKNTNYRFNVCNAEESEGKVILQLYLKDQLMGSTFDTQEKTDLQQFDFTCGKTATYEVVMSFDQGKPGCAVGIVSLIPDEEVEVEDEEFDVMYAQADNPVTVYYPSDDYPRIEVSVDNGTIRKVDETNFIVRPDEPGTVLVNIRMLYRSGALKEFKQKRYVVLQLDKPYAVVRGSKNDKISKQDLLQSGRIDLWFSEDMRCSHVVTSFTMSDKDDTESGFSSTSARLTKAQRDWISDLPSGTKIYIKNIQARTSDYVVMDIPPLEIEIE